MSERENNNKIKLLKLIEILRMETDENNPISRKDLCARLEEEGILCDIRTLSKDIKVLNEFGYEVMIEKTGNEKYYYVADREFEVPEIRVLIDAMQAASFLTAEKTRKITEKLARLGGSHQADIIKKNIVIFNTRKHSNAEVIYSVDKIEQAVCSNKKITFGYFDLDIKRNRVFRNNGEKYTVEPIALVYNEDNYYLIGFKENEEGPRNYRIDRMTSVEVIDEPISATAKTARKNISKITESEFKMYNGERLKIVIRFEKSVLAPVFDKFGEGIKVKETTPDTFETEVEVKLSPTFYGWLFTFAGRMTIVSPQKAIDEYKSMARKIAD